MSKGLWTKVALAPHPIGVTDDRQRSKIFASLGHEWYLGGAYSIRFAAPVFSGEASWVNWEQVEPDFGDRARIDFSLEKREGERTSLGWASRARPGAEIVSPWRRDESERSMPADDILPIYAPVTATPHARSCCLPSGCWCVSPTTARPTSGFWRHRPSAVRLVPPSEILYLVGATTTRSLGERPKQLVPPDPPPPAHALRAPIFPGQDGIVFGLLFPDTPYRAESWFYDVGRSSHSVFFTQEVTLSRGETPMAIVRTKARHLIRVLPGPEPSPAQSA